MNRRQTSSDIEMKLPSNTKRDVTYHTAVVQVILKELMSNKFIPRQVIMTYDDYGKKFPSETQILTSNELCQEDITSKPLFDNV